jgi:hypothetical protein
VPSHGASLASAAELFRATTIPNYKFGRMSIR